MKNREWFIPVGFVMILSVFCVELHSADMDWQGLPEGVGREEVFYTCQACHSLSLVKQQALNRQTWDRLLDWMVTEKNMPVPSLKTRTILLDYLTSHYGPKLGGSINGMPPISTIRP
ncbi:MAG: hypothetical protein HQL94_03575 [Magnetococcales bacterium]|nr:hypothetical protein [Magnetococcales bacterium]MBF0438378.1 hypothetical protein [Magnetococcales bacterium]